MVHVVGGACGGWWWWSCMKVAAQRWMIVKWCWCSAHRGGAICGGGGGVWVDASSVPAEGVTYIHTGIVLLPCMGMALHTVLLRIEGTAIACNILRLILQTSAVGIEKAAADAEQNSTLEQNIITQQNIISCA